MCSATQPVGLSKISSCVAIIPPSCCRSNQRRLRSLRSRVSGTSCLSSINTFSPVRLLFLIDLFHRCVDLPDVAQWLRYGTASVTEVDPTFRAHGCTVSQSSTYHARKLNVTGLSAFTANII